MLSVRLCIPIILLEANEMAFVSVYPSLSLLGNGPSLCPLRFFSSVQGPYLIKGKEAICFLVEQFVYYPNVCHLSQSNTE
jgi:hypothetical protein